MSTQQPTGTTVRLPELSAERVDEIEEALFADIARERDADRARRARRGRVWLAGGAAAAVIAVAAIIAPSIVPLVSGTAGEDSAVGPLVAPDSLVEQGGDAGGAVTESGGERQAGGSTSDMSSLADTVAGDRDIITSASATVSVDDVAAAARAIGDSAVARGGYVESMNIGTNGDVQPIDPMSGAEYGTVPSYPYPPDGAWVTVRVPADQLTATREELSDVGEVTASSVNRQDVTDQTVDLSARIEAAQASVDRLTALMAEATSVADLIAAESALAERQAMLESYQQQLEMLEDQIELSSLTVTLVPVVETVEADPAGFSDGLLAGWNGLVAALNGIVIALGFLIPWLAVAGVAGVIVWLIVRAVRRRNDRRRADASSARSTEESAPSK